MARTEGGELAHDVGADYPDRNELWTPLPAREVVVHPDSVLFQTLGKPKLCVNSLHRHAVESVPAPMRIVARESGAPIAQAIEHPGRPFWIGVQWHPEYLPQVPTQRRLFETLVQTAGAYGEVQTYPGVPSLT